MNHGSPSDTFGVDSFHHELPITWEQLARWHSEIFSSAGMVILYHFHDDSHDKMEHYHDMCDHFILKASRKLSESNNPDRIKDITNMIHQVKEMNLLMKEIADKL